MKYAICFTWKDGTKDTFDVYDAKARDWSINKMIVRKEVVNISYCKIYASGEYGERKVVK